jgi:hypothetical protein
MDAPVRTDTLTRDHPGRVQCAQPLPADNLAEVGDLWQEPADMAGKDHQAARRPVACLRGVVTGQRHRLLDQDVCARVEAVAERLQVVRLRGGDNHGVGPLGREQVAQRRVGATAEPPGRAADTLGVHVRHAAQVGCRMRNTIERQAITLS